MWEWRPSCIAAPSDGTAPTNEIAHGLTTLIMRAGAVRHLDTRSLGRQMTLRCSLAATPTSSRLLYGTARVCAYGCEFPEFTLGITLFDGLYLRSSSRRPMPYAAKYRVVEVGLLLLERHEVRINDVMHS